MENAQEILVVILASALAISLLLGIVLLIICIKIASHIRHISERAEAISNKAENVADFLAQAATPMMAGKFVSNIVESIFGKRKRRSK